MLGELQISGRSVQRLVLRGEPYTVVLNQPAARLKVPVGNYYPFRVLLKHGQAVAYLNFAAPQADDANVTYEKTGAHLPVLSPPRPEHNIVVNDQRPAVLAVGGPLTNCVSATTQGRELKLTYALLGAGGGEYRLVYRGTDGPPEFTIRKGGRKVGGASLSMAETASARTHGEYL